MRNVILVTMDSLRADHCSYWGYDRETTPTLDRMAEDGLTFENAVSAGPSTPESMPVSFTGTYPTRPTETSASSLLAERREIIRRHMQAHETLAEQFSRAGYATAGFSPNPYTSRYFGFDAGFDRYEDFMGGSRERLYRGMLDGVLDTVSKASVLPIRLLLNWAQREEVFKPWEAFYDAIVEWTRNAEEPYFLWVLLMDTHDPYLVPSEYRTQSRWAMYRANYRLWRQGHEPPFPARDHDRLVRAYDDSIRYADAFLARLRQDLSGDDPLVAVHGDHGEAFGEHGTYGHHPRLYEENIHVPFVIGGVSESETIATPFSLRRLPEVLLSLAAMDGVPNISRPLTVTQTLDRGRITARGNGWKYIQNEQQHGIEEELYNLESSESEELQNGELRHLGRQMVESQLETLREQYRIAKASREVEHHI